MLYVCMPKLKTRGRGITRRAIEVFDISDPTDRAIWNSDPSVNPSWDFPLWLDQQEAWLNGTLNERGLPRIGGRVCYDRENWSDWRYSTVNEPPMSSIDEVNAWLKAQNQAQPVIARAWAYLQEDEFQSCNWYLGKIMQYVEMCRDAMARESLLELAGLSVELGIVLKECNLGFVGLKRIDSITDSQSKSAARTNEIKRRKKRQWQGEVRRIVSSSPDITLDNSSQAARMILDRWPESPVKFDALRKYVRTLAKR